MRKTNRHTAFRIGTQLLSLLLLTAVTLVQADDDDERVWSRYTSGLELREVKWESGDRELVVKGRDAGRYADVTVSNAAGGAVLAQFRANSEGKFEEKIENPSPVPCRIRATANGESDERSVYNAPSDCDQGSGGGDGGGDGDGGGGDGVSEHQNLTYTGPGTCLECHDGEAHDLFNSTHYQWMGDTPYMLNATGQQQGKYAGAVNTYCGNITGNWAGCSACHIGLGAEPEPNVSQAQLENIDCLICHQEQYKRKKVNGVMVPDTDNMAITLDEAVRTVHAPTRVTCLQCHAKAGGGDAVKRGDLALATGNTTDESYDVHMATTGADLSCQDCHAPQNHRFPGKGSDIRPTDLDQSVECASSGCHGSSPHDSRDLNRHTAKVACQSCHIPVYGKNAADSAATEATEMDRSWQSGTHHTSPPFHPVLTKANNLIPVYRHWNRYSDNYLLGDTIFANPETGTYETSVPDGAVNDPDSKLYPFKYKTSDYPLHVTDNKLVALDTSVFFATADADAAALSGLANMGYANPSMDDFQWVTTDTYQLLNHQVSREDDALGCNSCHLNTARMDLQGELGYAPVNKNTATCSSGCHDADDASEWTMGSLNDLREGHGEHRGEGVDCAECHAFSRN